MRLISYRRVGRLGQWQEPVRYASDADPRTLIYAKGGVTVPVGGGQQVTVTLSPQTGGIIPAGTVDRAKAWLTEQTIFAGWPNWQVAGAGVLLFMALRGRR